MWLQGYRLVEYKWLRIYFLPMKIFEVWKMIQIWEKKIFKNLTCSSVISFSAILGSEGLLWAEAPEPLWAPEWLVAGQEECLLAPQNAAAELPPISIMLEPCTCIILPSLLTTQSQWFVSSDPGVHTDTKNISMLKDWHPHLIWNFRKNLVSLILSLQNVIFYL